MRFACSMTIVAFACTACSDSATMHEVAVRGIDYAFVAPNTANCSTLPTGGSC